MFGLSTKEMLSRTILNVSQNNILEYQKEVKNNLATLENATEEEANTIIMQIRKQYLDSVSENVFSIMQGSSPSCSFRLSSVMLTPALCGYEDIDIDKGLMAGNLFAICYFALTNKKASSKECIRLNHLQADIMDRALVELS